MLYTSSPDEKEGRGCWSRQCYCESSWESFTWCRKLGAAAVGLKATAAAQFATRCRQSFLLHACSIFFFSLDALYYFGFFLFFSPEHRTHPAEKKMGEERSWKSKKIRACKNYTVFKYVAYMAMGKTLYAIIHSFCAYVRTYSVFQLGTLFSLIFFLFFNEIITLLENK